MNRPASVHLNYDQLHKALVDKSDLEDAAKAHLETCIGCQQKVTRLVQRFDHLGKMAKKMAPEPAQAFRVPERMPTTARWQFKPALALGMLGAMIMVLTVWSLHFESSDMPVQMVAQNSAMEDALLEDALMDEIDALVADALPAVYRELASVSDSQSIEDLIEWVVPSIEEEDDLEPRA